MALSKATAGKIVDIVAADPECQRRITWTLLDPKVAAIMPPVVTSFLQGIGALMDIAQIAGGVRNSEKMLAGTDPGSDDFDKLCCAGIAATVVQAIYRSKSQLPEVRAAPALSRTVNTVAHTANCFMMQDGSEYVFDWHATLQIRDPAINTSGLWMLGARGFNYRWMPDFP